VTAIATGLSKVKLEELTIHDLAGVRSLAVYWDTLGWVHFKRGNLDLAEKYLTAAWQLEQYSAVGDHLGQISEKLGKKEEAIRWYTLATAGVREIPAARENLIRLAGSAKLESSILKARGELNEFRTFKVGPALKGEKERLHAEFFVVLVPLATGKPKVEDVRFISGSEKLRPLASALRNVPYRMSFPDATQTKIIRRGALICGPSSEGCSFILLSPEFVTSVN
jgi:hypothetical protein